MTRIISAPDLTDCRRFLKHLRDAERSVSTAHAYASIHGWDCERDLAAKRDFLRDLVDVAAGNIKRFAAERRTALKAGAA